LSPSGVTTPSSIQDQPGGSTPVSIVSNTTQPVDIEPSSALELFVVQPRWTDCEATLYQLIQRHAVASQLEHIVHKSLQPSSAEADDCESYVRVSQSGTLQVALLASPSGLRSTTNEADEIEVPVDDALLFVDRSGSTDLPHGQLAVLATRQAVIYLAAYDAHDVDIEALALEFHRILLDNDLGAPPSSDERDLGGATSISVSPTVAMIGDIVRVDVGCLAWTATDFDGRVVGRQHSESGATTAEVVYEVAADQIRVDGSVPDGSVQYSIDYPIVAEFEPGPMEITGGCDGFGGHWTWIEVRP
jgi:hypothetical protein